MQSHRKINLFNGDRRRRVRGKENKTMLSNRENQKVPDVTFHTREAGEWKDVTTCELFAGRTVVVFALPGAFTPTCSASHLPRYEELVPAFFRAGVDDVLCISVNDAFVMDAWQKDQQVE